MPNAPVADLNNDARATGAFRIPLGAFERYMLADDRPDYPMAFAIAIEITGDLRRHAFYHAVSAALNRHPMLTCLVRRSWFGRQHWARQHDVGPLLDWREDDSLLERPCGDRIDLSREPGIRIWVRKQPQRSRITFQFHHAATDGLGAMQFIGDLLALYGMETLETGQEAPELVPLDASQLAARTETGLSALHLRTLKLALKEFFQLLFRVPACVALPRRADSPGSPRLPFPAFITRTFPRDINTRLKNLAARKSVTPNDLLLLAMFRTMRDWNRLQSGNSGSELLRIGIPVTLRTPRHDRMPAANVLSFLFVDQAAEMAGDDDESLRAIRWRTASIVSGEVAAAFVTGIEIGLRLPGLVPGVLNLSPCFASLTLGNVGDVKRQFRANFPLKHGKIVAGNVRLDALIGAAPVRRNTRVAVSLGVYAGTLFVNMHCDPRCFTRPQAEALAELYASHIRATAAGSLDLATKAA